MKVFMHDIKCERLPSAVVHIFRLVTHTSAYAYTSPALGPSWRLIYWRVFFKHVGQNWKESRFGSARLIIVNVFQSP